MHWDASMRGDRPTARAKKQRYLFFNEADILAFGDVLREYFPDVRFYPRPFDLAEEGAKRRLLGEAEIRALKPLPDLTSGGTHGIEIVRCPAGWEPEWQVEEVPEGYRHYGLGRCYVRYRLLNPLDLVIRYSPTCSRAEDGSLNWVPGGAWVVYDPETDQELVRWARQVWRLTEKLATNKLPLYGPCRRDQAKVYPKENLVTVMGWVGWNLIEEQMARGAPVFARSWMRELGTKPWPPPSGTELGG